ncbi:MAG: hypothetical protein IPI32_05555 [Austwickia sp.]|jgi:hypothetical protein|nr:hypothetical protein [Austwickia sp.]MBK8435717.1 hypothetical protein [Austwickia sp.]MBK9100721.1 hypothetical protein [Austwickia sp.]
MQHAAEDAERLVLDGRIEDAVSLTAQRGAGSVAEVFSTTDGFLEDRYDAHRAQVLEFLRRWLPLVPADALDSVAEEVFGACTLGLASEPGAQQVAAAYLNHAVRGGRGDRGRLTAMLADVTRHPDYDAHQDSADTA